MNNAKSLGVAVMAAAMIANSPSAAAQNQPREVVVGILDVRSDSLTFGDEKTDIAYKEFTAPGKMPANWQTESGADHGQLMASAFVRQIRQIDRDIPIRILGANVFQENQSTSSALYTYGSRTGSKRTLSVNWEGAKEALSWFKQNGVSVVLTAFNGSDSNALRSFMKEAGDLGMTVFASAGNKVGGAIYPAAYPEAISVAGDNKDLAFRKDPSISTWANFAMDGGTSLRLKGGKNDEGSSFATAKAAAFGAYFKAIVPDAERDDIKAAIAKVSISTSYKINGSDISASRIDETLSAEKFVSVAAEAAKGVKKDEIVIARPAPSSAMMAAALSGNSR